MNPHKSLQNIYSSKVLVESSGVLSAEDRRFLEMFFDDEAFDSLADLGLERMFYIFSNKNCGQFIAERFFEALQYRKKAKRQQGSATPPNTDDYNFQ